MTEGRRQDGAGCLYVVATPIGNLEDLSPRAARILAEVDLIAAEDTRVTGKLLARAVVKTPTVSYREENERRLSVTLVERIQGGESIALVSDAGTPCISDPGYRLVAAAAEAGLEIVSVPGPSSVIALLSIAGLPTDRFSFEGFAPTKTVARRKVLTRLIGSGGTAVFLESPRRLVAFLDEVAAVFGDPRVAVGRELTKLYEEVVRGRASEVAERWRAAPPKGEVTVAVEIPAAEAELTGEALKIEVAKRVRAGETTRDIVVALKEYGVPRREVYALVQALAEPSGE
ncbi:MAG: 16S rRNA (cytidine1402-2'-O)-methyltransferase [Hyphomicrobiaceae bacterium]|jgi:16S rRNA (cytidine1402-2'-O)-methyltransferase